jgi:hypothetical protein
MLGVHGAWRFGDYRRRVCLNRVDYRPVPHERWLCFGVISVRSFPWMDVFLSCSGIVCGPSGAWIGLQLQDFHDQNDPLRRRLTPNQSIADQDRPLFGPRVAEDSSARCDRLGLQCHCQRYETARCFGGSGDEQSCLHHLTPHESPRNLCSNRQLHAML